MAAPYLAPHARAKRAARACSSGRRILAGIRPAHGALETAKHRGEHPQEERLPHRVRRARLLPREREHQVGPLTHRQRRARSEGFQDVGGLWVRPQARILGGREPVDARVASVL